MDSRLERLAGLRVLTEPPWGDLAAMSRNESSFKLNELLEALLESGSCGVLVVDAEGRIRLTTKEFDGALGVLPSVVVGRPLSEILPCRRGLDGGSRCEPGISCVSCEVNRVALATSRDGKGRKGAITLEVRADDVVRTVEVELGAVPLTFANQKLVLVTIENLDKLDQLNQWAHHGGRYGMLGTNPQMIRLFEMIVRVGRL